MQTQHLNLRLQVTVLSVCPVALPQSHWVCVSGWESLLTDTSGWNSGMGLRQWDNHLTSTKGGRLTHTWQVSWAAGLILSYQHEQSHSCHLILRASPFLGLCPPTAHGAPQPGLSAVQPTPQQWTPGRRPRSQTHWARWPLCPSSSPLSIKPEGCFNFSANPRGRGPKWLFPLRNAQSICSCHESFVT